LFGNPPIYEIAVTLRPKSYISHYPAVFLHELTTQVPKTIYTTKELTAKLNRNPPLTQEAIDKAFLQPQRRSQLLTEYEDYTIILLNSKFSNRSGVLLSTRYKNAFSYTGVERTLMDITVRPNYAGGAFAVLEAYRRAVSRNEISTNKFLANLKNMHFIYPYHQAIGFYLEKAGYSGKLLDSLRGIPMPFKFYLDYEMKDKSYDQKWKIWYPTGM
jgi:predicted transcriptional regulator of viral defense system